MGTAGVPMMDKRHARVTGPAKYAFCYPRDAMLARVFATATCLSVRLSHAGIVPSRGKAGS